MNISPELQLALDKTRRVHKHVCPDMARNIVSTIYRARVENQVAGIHEDFGQTLRNALNRYDLRINRSAYKTLVGHYFGRRGNAAVKSGQTKPKMRQPEKPPCKTEENGQIALII